MLCPRTGDVCKGQCHARQRAESDPQWYVPTSLDELAALYTANPNSRIKLITGDTGRGTLPNKYLLNFLHVHVHTYNIVMLLHKLLAAGVFKAPEQVDIFVDLKQISQLYSTVVSFACLFS